MVGTAAEILEDDQVQIPFRNAGGTKHGALGQGKIFAVATAAVQRVGRSEPSVCNPELDPVVHEADARIDVTVHRLELCEHVLVTERCGEGAGAADARPRNLVPARIERAAADRQGNAVEHVRTIRRHRLPDMVATAGRTPAPRLAGTTYVL